MTMVDYMERETVIKAIEKADCAVIADDAESCKTDYLREIIKSVPAADVAPVVRCKGCKNSCKDGTGRTCEGYWYELSEFAVLVEDDDFCSYGERKPSADG